MAESGRTSEVAFISGGYAGLGKHELDSPRVDATQNSHPVQDNEFDIPADAYGSAILAIVKDSPAVFSGSCTAILAVRLTFAILLLALNLLLQGSILFFIETQVVSHSVRHVQEIYRDFHERSFDADGTFRKELWAAETGKAELCQIAMTSPTFYFCTLFLWTMAMIGEFRQGQRLVSNIMRVPVCTAGGDMVEVGDNLSYIKSLTRPVRVALLFSVCLPKILIAFTLLGVGWRWLSATTSFEELVMNSVAMEFVTRIDDMLYEFAVPESYKHEVREINFLVRAPAKTEAQETCDEWHAYKRSVGYLILAGTLVILYTRFQDVLPPGIHDVKEHCAAWQQTEDQPLCHSFLEKLTTGKPYEDCYPFGR